MSDPFEDIKREYTNRYHETSGVLLASSYDEFVDKILSACMTMLNDTAEGQELMDPLLADAIRNQLSPEAWSEKKANLLKVLFFLVVDSCSYLKHEMAHHLYNELRKENTHE